MDKLTRGRRPLRNQLRRIVTDSAALIGKENPDAKELRVNLELLDKAATELEQYDLKIKEQLIEENATEEVEQKEFEGIEEYSRMYLKTRTELVEAIGTNESTRIDQGSSSMTDGKRRKFHLPEVKLRTFGGNLKDWLGWWSQYEKIHLDEELHDTDKFQYLSQAMLPGSEAKDLIDSYPQTEGNYAKAVEALRERFGRQDLLLQVYVRELLTLVITNVTSKEKLPLSQLYVRLESHLRSLTELNLDKADPATWLFPMVESSLSEETLRAWQRSQQSKVDGTLFDPPKTRLDLLMEFVKLEVQSEQQISLAQQGFQPHSQTTNRVKMRLGQVKMAERVPTVAGLIVQQDSGCVFCGKSHDPEKCFKAKTMSVDEKRRIIRDKRLCYRCLRAGHLKRNCRSIVKCEICEGKHYRVICFKANEKQKDQNMPSQDQSAIPSKKPRTESTPSERTKTFNQASNQCSTMIQLNTLKVQVKDKTGKLKTVRLVGDNGSQRSYISEEIARSGNCQWMEDEWLQNVLFGGARTPPSKFPRHCVTIYGLNGIALTFELLAKQTITGQLSEIPSGPWIEEFGQHGVEFTDLGDNCSAAEILIGNDYWGSIRTGRMIKLSCGLVAEETVFGWVLGGPIPVKTLSNMIASS